MVLSFDKRHKVLEVKYYVSQHNPSSLVTVKFVIPVELDVNDYIVETILDYFESNKAHKLKSWSVTNAVTLDVS